ncbi:hypothetical protein EQG49_02100 [Periweissella cryptocerci]|uniref:Uncharacterized protein n=1 Tax=Periweissella cryptocerci TaxID=2506420 RepID=A0A4P6YRP7_9LACO|nr:hypothetical protein [Periweissella cryptocerci]QBO35339.1 hypothetical protein EQG49_02100 [Periweissella cryptocerci]
MSTHAVTIVTQSMVGNEPEPFFDVITFLADLDETQAEDVAYLRELAEKTQLSPAYEEDGQKVYDVVGKVIDVYELIDEITFTGNPEVNSRQILPAKPMNLEQFIETYYSDYVLEDAES